MLSASEFRLGDTVYLIETRTFYNKAKRYFKLKRETKGVVIAVFENRIHVRLADPYGCLFEAQFVDAHLSPLYGHSVASLHVRKTPNERLPWPLASMATK
jgi:hypothetical protein